MAYKAPPNNEGYDLICIHPDPKEKSKIIKVQVKSRYQTDSNGEFLVKEKSFNTFDYLIAVFLNVGHFYKKNFKDENIGPAILHNSESGDQRKLQERGFRMAKI